MGSESNQAEGSEVCLERHQNRMAALQDGREVGALTVTPVELQWCRDLVMPLAGISAVQTEECCRGRGIGGRLMEEALCYARERAYPCSGVNAATVNPARRLYARAGFEVVFFIDRFYRKPRRRKAVLPPGMELVPLRKEDLPAALAFRQTLYRDAFGLRPPDPALWMRGQGRTSLDEDPASALLARRDGRLVGFASTFTHWQGAQGELAADLAGGGPAPAAALLRTLENRLAERGADTIDFKLCRSEQALRALLLREGYLFEPLRVFQLHVLDWQALLDRLAPAIVARVRAAAPAWSGTLRITTAEGEGSVTVGEGGARWTLAADRPMMTRVLCGAVSAWEAYLRGRLEISPRPGRDAAAPLWAAFPFVSCVHPTDGWW